MEESLQLASKERGFDYCVLDASGIRRLRQGMGSDNSEGEKDM
jgi:hypothetical protein